MPKNLEMLLMGFFSSINIFLKIYKSELATIQKIN